jgi:quercetin dioxygenase-like cupin family protein
MAVDAPKDLEEAQQTFTFFDIHPQLLNSGKATTTLAQSDILTGTVMVAESGGETIVHSHSGMDQIFVVLAGQAAFYTTEQELVKVLGPMEGVLVPRNIVYWYEKTGEENLVLFRAAARLPDGPHETIRVTGQLRESKPVEPRDGAYFAR